MQDSEIVISIFSPQREKLAKYNKYDITILGDKFRSITCIKNRYGESDVEIPVNFFGRCGIWKELPKPDEIFDYEKYKTPYYLLNKEEIKLSEDAENKQNFKFVL